MNFNSIRSKPHFNKVLISGSFALAIIALSIYLYLQPSTELKKEDLRISAILASHNFIKEKLRTPDKAVFQPVDSAEYYIEKGWYQNYHYVVSYFDAESSEGKWTRINYTMELQKTKTVWLMIDLDVSEK